MWVLSNGRRQRKEDERSAVPAARVDRDKLSASRPARPNQRDGRLTGKDLRLMADRTATKVEFRTRTDGPILGSVTLDRKSGYWFVRIGDTQRLRTSLAKGVQDLLAALVSDREVTPMFEGRDPYPPPPDGTTTDDLRAPAGPGKGFPLRRHRSTP
jgi:hypothetical protein